VHPGDDNDHHELFLMCDDLAAVVRSLLARGVQCTAPLEERWGTVASVTLPGGGKLGVYQPKHPRPTQVAAKRRRVQKRAPAKKKAKRHK
jgi:hypothetical protein